MSRCSFCGRTGESPRRQRGEDRRAVGRALERPGALERGGHREPATAVGDDAPQRDDVLLGVDAVAGRRARGFGEAVPLLPHADGPGGHAGLLGQILDRELLHRSSGQRTALRPIGIPGPQLGSEAFVREPDPILVTGATGYVGSKLVAELQSRGHAVRTLSRRGAGAGDARTGDVLSGAGTARGARGRQDRLLPGPLDGLGGDFAAKDRQAAVNFAEAAATPASSVSSTSAGSARRTPSTCAAATRSPSCCARGSATGSSTCGRR